VKLLAKYNRVNSIVALLVILAISIVYYQVISMILNRQVDQNLEVEEQEIFDFVKLNHHLPQVFKSTNQQIIFQNSGSAEVVRLFINTDFYNSREKESGRGLISSVTVGNQHYKVLIVESKVETEDLLQIIFGITLALIVILLVVLFMINRFILQRLWQPFYDSLSSLKSFNITDKENILKHSGSGIKEFDELNLAIGLMADKVIKDYNDLKNFTENASHELLTPIAVINSKLDSLLQTDQFSESQSKLMADLYESVARLTHLNKAMLLLAKIENQMMPDKRSIRINTLLEDQLQRFNELFAMKNISVTSFLAAKEVTANKFLVEILFTNLIGNAIRHNLEGGTIDVKLNQQELVISNTGCHKELQAEEIFNRFSKSAESEGCGLGLTISRQICLTNNWALSYRFTNLQHRFVIRFAEMQN
jgi:signal transduction histidine kinase